MRWKQFFTHVRSLDAPEAGMFMEKLAGNQFNLLDVRQPAEYAAGHLPGARLTPLPDLSAHVGDIDPKKPTLVY